MDFGNQIKQIWNNENITQQEFANKIKVSRQSVSKWENNKIEPNISNVKEICKQFNVSSNTFFNINQKHPHDNHNISCRIWKKCVLAFIICTAFFSWLYPRLTVINFIELLFAVL